MFSNNIDISSNGVFRILVPFYTWTQRRFLNVVKLSILFLLLILFCKFLHQHHLKASWAKYLYCFCNASLFVPVGGATDFRIRYRMKNELSQSGGWTGKCEEDFILSCINISIFGFVCCRVRSVQLRNCAV
jgi:hypothetical protein